MAIANVKILVNGMDPKPHLYDIVGTALNGAVSKFDLNPDSISFTVADHDNMIISIKEIDSSLGMTDSRDLVAVGKTISREENGKLKHYVILNVNIVGGMISLLMEDGTDTVEKENCLYMVFHELGHCLDNKKRNINESFDALDTKIFSIDKISSYYTPIVLGEFFASYHSSFMISPQLFKYQSIQCTSSIEDCLIKFPSMKEKYKQGNAHLFNIAHLGAQTAWFILVQYSKIISYAIWNERSFNVDIELWDGASERMKDILDKFSSLLFGLIEKYPYIPCNIEESLKSIWHETALAIGFDFQRGTTGDAVYF